MARWHRPVTPRLPSRDLKMPLAARLGADNRSASPLPERRRGHAPHRDALLPFLLLRVNLQDDSKLDAAAFRLCRPVADWGREPPPATSLSASPDRSPPIAPFVQCRLSECHALRASEPVSAWTSPADWQPHSMSALVLAWHFSLPNAPVGGATVDSSGGAGLAQLADVAVCPFQYLSPAAATNHRPCCACAPLAALTLPAWSRSSARSIRKVQPKPVLQI